MLRAPMSLPKLYLETTIPSYLTARRSPLARIATDQQTTQDWWDFQRHEYDLFISEAVIEEISLVPKLQLRHALGSEVVLRKAGASAGWRTDSRPQTPHPREVELRPQVRSQAGAWDRGSGIVDGEAAGAGERARPACWRRRPAFANFPARRDRKARAITPHAAGSSFRRDAETSTRDACAPRKRSVRRFHAMPGFR